MTYWCLSLKISLPWIQNSLYSPAIFTAHSIMGKPVWIFFLSALLSTSVHFYMFWNEQPSPPRVNKDATCHFFTLWWRNCVWALIQIYGDTEGQNRERCVDKFVFSTTDSVMDLLTGSTAQHSVATDRDDFRHGRGHGFWLVHQGGLCTLQNIDWNFR